MTLAASSGRLPFTLVPKWSTFPVGASTENCVVTVCFEVSLSSVHSLPNLLYSNLFLKECILARHLKGMVDSFLSCKGPPPSLQFSCHLLAPYRTISPVFCHITPQRGFWRLKKISNCYSTIMIYYCHIYFQFQIVMEPVLEVCNEAKGVGFITQPVFSDSTTQWFCCILGKGNEIGNALGKGTIHAWCP